MRTVAGTSASVNMPHVHHSPHDKTHVTISGSISTHKIQQNASTRLFINIPQEFAGQVKSRTLDYIWSFPQICRQEAASDSISKCASRLCPCCHFYIMKYFEEKNPPSTYGAIKPTCLCYHDCLGHKICTLLLLLVVIGG